jgi:ABC-type multidrug transport system fused ATPase/permease subunit
VVVSLLCILQPADKIHTADIIQRYTFFSTAVGRTHLVILGTVRAALDPFSKYDDTRLWDALRRSYLVETRPSTPIDPEATAETRHRLTLDTVIETDGANLSMGERSLLSLARALVKDSRVVILDEAT